VLLFRPAILLSVVPLVAVPVAAQVNPPAQTLEQQLTQLSEDWMRAVWDKDDVAINRLMADEFVLFSPGAPISKRQTKPDWLRNARIAGSGECEYSNVHVQAIGEVAVMAAEMHCKGDFHGIGFEASSIVSDVWVKRDGMWKIAARIASTSPRFLGIWMPLFMGAALPLAAWCWFAVTARFRQRNSLLSSANRF
jgi:ketosteroid isomerase-like protein